MVKPDLRRCLAPDLALTQNVAVGLVVVGRGARSQPVHLVVAGQVECARIALDQRRQTALASGEVQLAHVTFVRARERNRVQRRVDVGVHRTLAPHTFKRHEPTRRNRHSLVVQRRRRVDLVVQIRLGRVERRRQARIRSPAGRSRCSSGCSPHLPAPAPRLRHSAPATVLQQPATERLRPATARWLRSTAQQTSAASLAAFCCVNASISACWAAIFSCNSRMAFCSAVSGLALAGFAFFAVVVAGSAVLVCACSDTVPITSIAAITAVSCFFMGPRLKHVWKQKRARQSPGT